MRQMTCLVDVSLQRSNSSKLHRCLAVCEEGVLDDTTAHWPDTSVGREGTSVDPGDNGGDL